MKHIAFSTGLAGMLLVCSCDKHNVLQNERARVEAEIKKCHDDLAAIDAKALALGIDLTTAHSSIDMQSAAWKSKNSALEQELASLSAKCAEGEAAMKIMRAKLDSYKAKYLR